MNAPTRKPAAKAKRPAKPKMKPLGTWPGRQWLVGEHAVDMATPPPPPHQIPPEPPAAFTPVVAVSSGSVYARFTEGFDTANLQEAKALLEELS